MPERGNAMPVIFKKAEINTVRHGFMDDNPSASESNSKSHQLHFGALSVPLRHAQSMGGQSGGHQLICFGSHSSPCKVKGRDAINSS